MTDSAEAGRGERPSGDARAADIPAGTAEGELVAELEEGWAPLPTRTLFALVLGGLRVRMMRSLVTMVTIVLAIAFLTYTGFSSKLYFNLAEEVQRLAEPGGLDARQVDEAASVVMGADLFGPLSREEGRRAAVDLAMDDVEEQARELAGLTGPLSKARGDLEEARRKLAGVETDPEAIEADLEAARTALADARAELESLEGLERSLTEEIRLGRWLASGGEEGEPGAADGLVEALSKRRQDLFARASRFGQMMEGELDRVGVILALAERQMGADEAVVTLGNALREARRQRGATDLRMSLRRAGVSVESTLQGSTLDTWLIIMALMTCTVGIANAVLMSVTERFREIGTMKCLGAQDGLVVKMFLLESGMLGVVGALTGIVLGTLVALAAGLAQFGAFGLYCFPLAQGLPVAGWSLAAGCFLAVVGAVYPALVAARMQPVDALRADE